MAELISAEIDGELAAGEEPLLHRHLSQCSNCSRLEERLRWLETGFAQLPVRRPPRLRPRPRWIWYGLAVTAAALTFSVWRVQAPPAQLALESGPLYGKWAKGATRFQLHLDSQTRSCPNLQLQLSYDFEGDGRVDRVERYRPFSTDNRPGWQVFSEQIGLREVQGEMRDFEGGKLVAMVLNAPPHLLILAGKSRLSPPHELSSVDSSKAVEPADQSGCPLRCSKINVSSRWAARHLVVCQDGHCILAHPD